jgi:hypothetical protein
MIWVTPRLQPTDGPPAHALEVSSVSPAPLLGQVRSRQARAISHCAARVSRFRSPLDAGNTTRPTVVGCPGPFQHKGLRQWDTSKARTMVTISIEPGAVITIHDASTVEGTSGSTIATFAVELTGSSPRQVPSRRNSRRWVTLAAAFSGASPDDVGGISQPGGPAVVEGMPQESGARQHQGETIADGAVGEARVSQGTSPFPVILLAGPVDLPEAWHKAEVGLSTSWTRSSPFAALAGSSELRRRRP